MGAHDFSENEWTTFLRAAFDREADVSFGRSRTAPVQVRSRVGRSGSTVVEIRLHRMFAEAPPSVRDALVKWLRSGRRATRAGPILDEWIHERLADIPVAPRRIAVETAGRAHDLDALAAPLFARCENGRGTGEFAHDFEEGSRPVITWGRRVRSRSRRSIRLGSFEPESRVVRVHPVLDQEAVPAWFVTFVLKHELLHAAIEAYRDDSGRWVHHGPEFRARERSWPEYERAVRWERENLARVIRSAREGTAMRVRKRDLEPPVGVRQGTLFDCDGNADGQRA